MLRELDRQLIREELQRFDTPNAEQLQLTQEYIEDLLSAHYCKELTEHWYDDSPNECEECDKDDCCSCQVLKQHEGSEKQLRFNNWVDVYAEGVFSETKEQVDGRARCFLESILRDADKDGRLWLCQDDWLLYIYYYNRDREKEDYWFIFEPRD